jgi:hypothetical protein
VLRNGGILQLSQLAAHLPPPMASNWSYSFMTGSGL